MPALTDWRIRVVVAPPAERRRPVTVDSAWIGAGGVLVGGIATALLGMVAEAKRARHALALRKVELREEHVGRLHLERRAAYADFYRSFWRLQKTQQDVVEAMQEMMKTDPRDWEPLRQANDGLMSVTDEVGERLMQIELVASTPVATAARDMRSEADRLLFTASSAGPDEDDARREAEHRQRIDTAEQVLREAIRIELDLDR